MQSERLGDRVTSVVNAKFGLGLLEKTTKASSQSSRREAASRIECPLVSSRRTDNSRGVRT
jgi:hypothetical protein